MRHTITYQQTDARPPRKLLESMIRQQQYLQWTIGGDDNDNTVWAEGSYDGYRISVAIQSTMEPVIKEITIVQRWNIHRN